MKSTQYSDKVLNHFKDPRNVGKLEGENVALGKVGNPVCGDLMEMYIEVEDEKIKDVKFQTFGCGSAIATSSMITELVKGKTLDEAMKVTRNDVADELDGLPPVKMHCSNLAADALHDAIKNYKERNKQKSEAIEKKSKRKVEIKEIPGEKEFLNKGVYYKIDDFSAIEDKRVMVLDTIEKAIDLAVELTKYTGRVIFVTASKDLSNFKDMNGKIKQSNVKILFESELKEIKGFNEVEKVVIHDLDEDNDYELFVDSVILL